MDLGSVQEGVNMKIMVAIDESECSEYALEWTLKNLHHIIQKSELVIFTAQPFYEPTYLSASGVVSPGLISSYKENQKQVALGLLQKANKMCDKYGVTARVFTKAGEPKEAICEIVGALNIDLLIVGSHGRKALPRLFLGSVSNYCLHHADCSVIVVKEDR